MTKSDLEIEKRIEDFLKEITDVCKKYGISISHEDSQGTFILEDYNEYDIDWLKEASVNIGEKHDDEEDKH